ncbi:MAG: hypothetical protein Q9181_004265 [Wetmoreana brouardii]
MAFTDEEMAHYQRLSNNYVSDAQVSQHGLGIGQSIDLTRTTGTSPLAFGYFEALLHSGDTSRVLAEVARLKSLNNLLDTVGYRHDIYGDFVDETLQLLKQTATIISNHDDAAALLTNFTQPGVSDAIIMHFRTRADRYVHYTEHLSVDQYCSTHIEPHAVEIEHLGMQACIEAIINPAGIAIQVLYLDRSPGEQVNEHEWPAEPSSAAPQFTGVYTIRLLYRPGHYDILYKPEDIAVLSTMVVTNPMVVTDPQINFVSNPLYMSSSNQCYSPQGLDLNRFYMPGLTSAGISTGPFSMNAYPINPTCAPFSPSITPASTEAYITPYCSPSQPISQPPPVQAVSSSGGFRPSKFQVERPFKDAILVQPEPCQTEAMKQ